jgi:hypothetical protein
MPSTHFILGHARHRLPGPAVAVALLPRMTAVFGLGAPTLAR